MHRITVVTLGPGSAKHLTLGGIEALKQARRIVLRTLRHGAADYLMGLGLSFTTFDDLHMEEADFEAFAIRAARELIQMAQETPICYGVADPGADETVRVLLRQAGEQVIVLSGVPLAAPMLAARDADDPPLITPATRLQVWDGQRPILLTELDSRALAGDCKLQLLAWYDADCTLYFFPPGQAGTRHARLTVLEDLDRQPRYDHTAGALLLPKAPYQKQRYDVQDLVLLMRRLRAPDGCPWDRQQTHQTLARYLIEEAHEAAFAIGQEDWQAAADELGDVLLQVIFHATVGEETGTMSLSDITTAICAKLITRHSHIFGGDSLSTAQEVSDNWDKIKTLERGEQSQSDKMRALPTNLPPTLRALKVQEIARKAGFDWDDSRGAFDKVLEETQELLEDHQAGRDTRPELGDLFFACINLARLLGADPDEVVNMTTEKFIKRFTLMEDSIKSDQKVGKYLTLSEWDVYWERSKQGE
jgi:tetrapyrrole methylase family protein/MazG family protein